MQLFFLYYLSGSEADVLGAVFSTCWVSSPVCALVVVGSLTMLLYLEEFDSVGHRKLLICGVLCLDPLVVGEDLGCLIVSLVVFICPNV